MQRVYSYRCAARIGKWKVRRAFSNYKGVLRGEGEANKLFGWVMCHEGFDALEVLERCSSITPGGGISNGNGRVDKVVLGNLF